MANFFEGQQISLPAAADLSTHQFKFVRMTATGINITTAATQVGVGVLQDDPNALSAPGAVMLNGGSKVILGGTVATGDNVTSDATGRAITTVTAGNQVLGVCVDGGAINEVGTILITSTQL